MRWKKGDIIRMRVMVVCPNGRDLIQKRGEVGKVVAFFPERQITTLLFKDRNKGVYMPEDLITMRSAKSILRALKAGVFINGIDYTIMLKVYRLVLARKYTKALKLAVTNDKTRFYCTISCREYFDSLKK